MGGNLTFNDNDDVQLKGATDLTLIGNVGDSLKVNVTNVGQKTMANSIPVVIASDQNLVATSANQTTEITSLQLIDNPIGSVGAGTAGTNSYLTGGVFNTTLPTLTNAQQAAMQLDSNGRLVVASTPLDGTRATYSAAIANLSAANLATDIFTITGSASKTIRILRIEFSGTETTGAGRDIDLVKRSSANTGGTSSTLTSVPHDSANSAGTATVRAYTVNPSALGTTVGTIRTTSYSIPATNLSGASATLIWDFGTRPGQAIVLRGTSEVLAVNLEGTTFAGNSLNLSIEWTEE